MRKQIATLVLCLLILPIGCLSVGCVAGLTNAGEIGFKQSTSWGFYHRAEATEGESRAELDLQPIIDYVVELQEQQEDSSEVVE